MIYHTSDEGPDEVLAPSLRKAYQLEKEAAFSSRQQALVELICQLYRKRLPES